MPKDQIPEAPSPSASTSFGIYESFRIVIPGVYTATLALLLYWAAIARYFAAPLPAGVIIVGFLFFALVSGFTLYAKETPKRRKAFLENQPSRHLSTRAKLSKSLPLLDEAEAQRLYFYLLNTLFPPAFHNKVFFFGAVYYIMTQLRRVSLSFAVLGTALVGVAAVQSASPSDLQAPAVFAISVWIVYLLNIRYNKADRKMQENYNDQILWMEMNQDLVDQVIRSYALKTRKS